MEESGEKSKHGNGKKKRIQKRKQKRIQKEYTENKYRKENTEKKIQKRIQLVKAKRYSVVTNQNADSVVVQKSNTTFSCFSVSFLTRIVF